MFDWVRQIPDHHANLLRGLIFLIAGGLLFNLGPKVFELYAFVVGALGLPFFVLWGISIYVRLRGPDFDELEQ